MKRFNEWLATKITQGVGTMYCAYAFALLALVSLPAILEQTKWFPEGTFPSWMVVPSLVLLVAWIAQTFLQLVLLSIIVVGQNLAAQKAEAHMAAHAAEVEKRDLETHDAVMATHTEAHAKLDSHTAILDGQNEILAAIHAHVVKPPVKKAAPVKKAPAKATTAKKVTASR